VTPTSRPPPPTPSPSTSKPPPLSATWSQHDCLPRYRSAHSNRSHSRWSQHHQVQKTIPKKKSLRVVRWCVVRFHRTRERHAVSDSGPSPQLSFSPLQKDSWWRKGVGERESARGISCARLVPFRSLTEVHFNNGRLSAKNHSHRSLVPVFSRPSDSLSRAQTEVSRAET
jgi:hypothetical protein